MVLFTGAFECGVCGIFCKKQINSARALLGKA
jgi:ferredoxin-like protein FixX